MGAQDDESSVASTQRLVTDAIKTATVTDYRKRLRSADKRVAQSAETFVKVVAQASERLSAAVVNPVNIINRCAEHLKEIEDKTKTHTKNITTNLDCIDRMTKASSANATAVEARIATSVAEVSATLKLFREKLDFAYQFNHVSMWIGALGLFLMLCYAFCETVEPTIKTRGRTMLLWFGSVAFSVCLTIKAYIIYIYGPELEQVKIARPRA